MIFSETGTLPRIKSEGRLFGIMLYVKAIAMPGAVPLRMAAAAAA